MGVTAKNQTLTQYQEIARLSLPGQWTPIGWRAPNSLSFDDWCIIGEGLSTITTGVHWWLGDYFAYGEHRWGEKYAQMMDETTFGYSTLSRDCRVASRIEFARRVANLSFSHHVVVSKLEPDKQDYWLARAAEGDNGQRWSVRRLEEEIAEVRNVISPPEPTAPEPLTTSADYRAARVELDAGAPKPERKAALEALVTTWERASEAAQEQADDVTDLTTCPNCGYNWCADDA